MRILITGGNGQLGRALQRSLSGHDVVALSYAQLDVADASAFDAAVDEHAPAMVIHSAALTDTMRCEREPALAEAVNAQGTANAARACMRTGAKLIAISTNEVFDGEKGTPYAEDDATNPINAYGRSKLSGEQNAHTVLGGEEIIVRTSWLYGDGESNYVEKVLAAARSRRALGFTTDEVATPTSAADLAGSIRHLIDQAAPRGIYHLTNGGEASRYEWACEIVRLAGIGAEIKPVTTDELRAGGYDGPRKPPYSTLENVRAAALGIALRPWREALAAHFERAHVPG